MSGVGWRQRRAGEGSEGGRAGNGSPLSPHLPGCSAALWFEPSRSLLFTTQGCSYQGKPQLTGCEQKSRPAVDTSLTCSLQRKDARLVSGLSESATKGWLPLELTQKEFSGQDRGLKVPLLISLAMENCALPVFKQLQVNFHTLGTGCL